ncbi:MAG: Gfo/Idh/MocA family oxidoreductase [Acidobacteria bacterium]|nr:Gfo/Idh/MocA family oxidoreductase [Acidobacteriota bacterium]
MRIAILGLGHVAEFQIEALTHVEDVTLVAAHDIDPVKAALAPEGVRFVEALDELLGTPGIDLFLVSTPNASHYEMGRRVLERGRSLLLEKPCCDKEEEMENLVELSRRHGAFFAVALHAAYARDVLWYSKQLTHGDLQFGPLTGFYSGFFDPYYKSGAIVEKASGLGGSWFDSGINALSVIGRFVTPDRIRLEQGRMTVVKGLPASEIQGAASFSYESDEFQGCGIVETNWSLGLDQKMTYLFYSRENVRVLLDHSNEQVTVFRGRERILAKNLRNQRPRLTNHYVNLFRDVRQLYIQNETNLAYASPLHRLLFRARCYKNC